MVRCISRLHFVSRVSDDSAFQITTHCLAHGSFAGEPDAAAIAFGSKPVGFGLPALLILPHSSELPIDQLIAGVFPYSDGRILKSLRQLFTVCVVDLARAAFGTRLTRLDTSAHARPKLRRKIVIHGRRAEEHSDNPQEFKTNRLNAVAAVSIYLLLVWTSYRA